MKRLLTLTVGLCLLGGFANPAGAADGEKKAKRKEARHELVEKYDKNKDGVLDAEEKAAAKKDLVGKRKALGEKKSLRKNKSGEQKPAEPAK